MLTRTTAQWQELLDSIDVPNQVPTSLNELIDSAQLKASGLVSKETHPAEGVLRVLGSPTYWNKTSSEPLTPAHGLGADTFTILAGIGYSQEALQRMIDEGAISQ